MLSSYTHGAEGGKRAGCIDRCIRSEGERVIAQDREGDLGSAGKVYNL